MPLRLLLRMRKGVTVMDTRTKPTPRLFTGVANKHALDIAINLYILSGQFHLEGRVHSL